MIGLNLRTPSQMEWSPASGRKSGRCCRSRRRRFPHVPIHRLRSRIDGQNAEDGRRSDRSLPRRHGRDLPVDSETRHRLFRLGQGRRTLNAHSGNSESLWPEGAGKLLFECIRRLRPKTAREHGAGNGPHADAGVRAMEKSMTSLPDRLRKSLLSFHNRAFLDVELLVQAQPKDTTRSWVWVRCAKRATSRPMRNPNPSPPALSDLPQFAHKSPAGHPLSPGGIYEVSFAPRSILLPRSCRLKPSQSKPKKATLTASYGSHWKIYERAGNKAVRLDRRFTGVRPRSWRPAGLTSAIHVVRS